jgi:hypothetical protein
MATRDAFLQFESGTPYSTPYPDIPQTFPATLRIEEGSPYRTAYPDIPQTFPVRGFMDTSEGQVFSHTMRAWDSDEGHHVFWRASYLDAAGDEYGGNQAALSDIVIFAIKGGSA